MKVYFKEDGPFLLFFWRRAGRCQKLQNFGKTFKSEKSDAVLKL
jgi:hypothetical protein